jgi:hypothetical protein
MALRLRMVMPPTRWPCGAPVPVGVAPTSRRRLAGGAKSMICQRSTGAAGFDESRWRRRVYDPAGDDHAVRRALDLDGGVLDERRIADGRFMYEGEMGEIEQVIDNELPIGLDVQIGALRAPMWIVEPMKVGNEVGIGARGLTHPDPKPAVTLGHGIGFHARARRNGVLARHPHALPGAVIAQAMIVALQVVADELAHGERQVAMDAAVFERDRRPVFLAKQHDRLAEDHAAERLAHDLAVGSGDVPEIP